MKTKIIIISIIMIMMILFFDINIVQAVGISDVISGGEDFMNAGNLNVTHIDGKNLQETSNSIYNILLIIGMVVAVIYSVILGIKFMIGSVEEKAEIKESLIPFIAGCIVVFGAFGIWKIFVIIGNSL